ncbi:MAG: hypothetical protein JSU07_13430 [Bacteroidetes bacterium]|nr:hypothetical protein [Bacteroidota bacterium]
MFYKNGTYKFTLVQVLIVCFIGLFNFIIAQKNNDTLKIKSPKHYFNSVLLFDFYGKPKESIKDTDAISKQLKSYGIKQYLLGFYTPIYTKNRISEDNVTSNSHVLLTGNFVLLQPEFAGISQHNLVKAGVGIRYIFNTGKKGVWFADVSPCITSDVTYKSVSYFRLANSFIYSRNVSERLNFRIGITKSFMFGNRNYLPFIGIRIGRVDGVNFDLQFPRSVSLNIPINTKLLLSVYTKPQGGMYYFSNNDSIYFNNDAAFHFTRYEINSGFRIDASINNRLSFYAAFGISARNQITFYSERMNNSNKVLNYIYYFYGQNIRPTGFLNTGIVFRFGNNRAFYGVKNLYDVMDLNNTSGIGDENIRTGNVQIPRKPSKKENYNLKSVQDLIDYNEQ